MFGSSAVRMVSMALIFMGHSGCKRRRPPPKSGRRMGRMAVRSVLANLRQRFLDLRDSLLADGIGVPLVDRLHGLAQAGLLGWSQLVHLHAGLPDVFERFGG